MAKQKFARSLNRREFIKHAALVSGGIALLPGMLTSCDDDEDDISYSGEFGFREGVASFDPTASSVILWTRYTSAPNETGDATIRWEVAESNSFAPLTKSGSAPVSSASDYTLGVDVTGLAANKKYYYRFRSDRTKAESVVGETRTLPTAGQASSVKLAVVSCANYQAGLFNVYGAVAESAADVVVHLGDYIYEYGAGQYGTNAATAMLKREHLPATEILSLEDYRTRYRQYRSDIQLQKAHQLKPFICVWDDHEVANDAYKDGAQNHQANEGSFEQRRGFAIQVWHEYLPARVADKAKIYRSFDFGGLVNLMMLDTRLLGRDKQLSLSTYFSAAGTFNTTTFLRDWQNPSRTMLGAEQKTWLTSSLSGSAARWQVLGSQVLVGKMYIPTELLIIVAGLASATTSAQTTQLLAQYSIKAAELVAIKLRIAQGLTVTPADQARVSTVLPYNLDAWDGYPREREAVFAAASNKKLISLAGDTHNAWYSDLKTDAGQKVGAEFATSSVSSPGFESILGGSAAAVQSFEQSNEILIDDLTYLDASQRGYMEVTFTSANATSEWKYVSSLTTLDTSTRIGRTVTES